MTAASCHLCRLGTAGPAGPGSLLVRDDWESRRASIKCALCWQVAGVQCTSKHLISYFECAALSYVLVPPLLFLVVHV